VSRCERHYGLEKGEDGAVGRRIGIGVGFWSVGVAHGEWGGMSLTRRLSKSSPSK
jgi:hypothetical protein